MTPRTAAATEAVVVIIAARNEADRIGDTLTALSAALPGAKVYVADDASTDATAEIAGAHGARVVTAPRSLGKGGNVSGAARAALAEEGAEGPVFLLCDADLAASAEELRPLLDAVSAGETDIAIASFSRRVGGGFGFAVGFSAWAIERATGWRPTAPISGQRALSADALRAVLPFARGYGMETGMSIDAIRAGFTIREIELDLEHRATGRTVSGFLHRGRQLAHFVIAYLPRRKGRRR